MEPHIELRTLSNELMESWVLSYGYSWVSSLTPEYSTMDSLRCAYRDLSIELQIPLGEFIDTWVFNYEHSWASWWRAEYWAMDTLGKLIHTWVFNYGPSQVNWWRAEYWAMDTLRWAHWHLSIQIWTLSGVLIDTWVFKDTLRSIATWVLSYRHSLVSSFRVEYGAMPTLE